MKIEVFKSKFKTLSVEEQTETISELSKSTEYVDTKFHLAFCKLIEWCKENKKEEFIVKNVSHGYFIKDTHGNTTRDEAEALIFTNFDLAYKFVRTPSYAVIDLNSKERLTGMTSK